jgi:hypothetical protein
MTSAAKRQPSPQPPPTYTSLGSVPDGYVTWASRRRDIQEAAVRQRGLCYPRLRDRAGVIRFGRLIDRKTVRRCVDASHYN